VKPEPHGTDAPPQEAEGMEAEEMLDEAEADDRPAVDGR
jgi:hypothetical protein